MLVERIPVLNEMVYQSKRADTAVAALGPAVRIASPPLLADSLGASSMACTNPANVDLVNLLDLNIEKGAPEPKFKGVNILQDLLDMDSKTTLKSPIEGFFSKSGTYYRSSHCILIYKNFRIVEKDARTLVSLDIDC